MTPSTITIVALSVMLAATNLGWFYLTVGSAEAVSDRESQCRLEHEALGQALAVLPVAARVDSTPDQVMATAMGAASLKDSFEKDGYLWVGGLGLQFGADGRLTAVQPAWQPF